jgi:histidinol-phosphatase (PHP family)
MTDPQAGAQPAALPGDNHVHTEWSWDAVAGSMEGSCARALELGLPSIAFTEHVDLARWVLTRKQAARTSPDRVDGDGRFEPPRLDVDGYLACVERCRDRFPDLRILSGVELGEPHWFEDEIDTLLSHGAFDRVLGSMHSVELDDGPWVVDALYGDDAPPDLDPSSVVRGYLQETVRMVESSGVFAVLAHIDYPVRHWPSDGPAFDPFDFEDEFRAVLRALASSGRALEVNTVVPLRSEIVCWWYEAGGQAVSFGSDAHVPDVVARRFADASAMVEAQGFRPGRDPYDFWRRRPAAPPPRPARPTPSSAA